MRRRMKDHGAAALQQFGEDFLPLILLFAISVTGLMLTASYTWMKGYAYDFLAILHAITVLLNRLVEDFQIFPARKAGNLTNIIEVLPHDNRLQTDAFREPPLLAQAFESPNCCLSLLKEAITATDQAVSYADSVK